MDETSQDRLGRRDALDAVACLPGRNPTAHQPPIADDPLQRDDPSARAVRHPRGHLVPGRVEPRRGHALLPQDAGTDRRLAAGLGSGRVPLPLCADRALSIRQRVAQYPAHLLGSAEQMPRYPQHGPGRHPRHRKSARHPSEEQAGRRRPAGADRAGEDVREIGGRLLRADVQVACRGRGQAPRDLRPRRRRAHLA